MYFIDTVLKWSEGCAFPKNSCFRTLRKPNTIALDLTLKILIIYWRLPVRANKDSLLLIYPSLSGRSHPGNKSNSAKV